LSGTTKSSARRPLRRAYRFILIVALVYVVFTPIWWLVTPLYSELHCIAANWAFNLNILSDDELTYTYEDGEIVGRIIFRFVRPYDNHRFKASAKETCGSGRVHFGVVIWGALLAATPFGNFRRKLIYFLGGWILLFVSQLEGLYLQVLFSKALTLQHLEPTYQSRLPAIVEYIFDWGGQFYVLIGNKLLPILFWLIVGLPFLIKGGAESKA
jgi:hypothetical protein